MGELIDLNSQIPDSRIPAAIARDTETAAAINAHVAAADPHAQYLLQAEADARYRQTAVMIADAGISETIARDSEITAALSGHVNAPGFHSVQCSIISTVVAAAGTETAVSIGVIPAAKIVGINAYILDNLGTSGIFYVLRGGGGDFNPTPRLTNGWIRIPSVVNGSQFIGDPIHFLVWHIP